MNDFYVIVGLGNPGREYQQTRHNVGFVSIDELSFRHKIPLNKSKFNAVFGKGRINGCEVMLVQPQTYMNNSGQAVRDIMDFYKIDPAKIILIYDDVDLELGALRIRQNGSAGTHNGMKSVIYQMKTQEFPRIRVGVGGKKHPNQDLADYVLGRFSKDELPVICDSVKAAASAAEEIVARGTVSAMNKFNGKIVM